MLLGFVLCVPWCGLLIRTWACCSESGQPRPRAEQAARVRNRRPACGTGGPRVKEGVQPYTRLAAMRASPLCGAWAFSSARGPAVPSLGNPAHVRDRRPACGIGGPRVKEGVQPYTRLAAMRASSLCGAWAFSSARGPAVPSLGNPAHVRDRRPACGTRWNPSRCCMRPIRICACCRWVHDPIGWRCTPSDWVQRSLTGAAPSNGCSAL